MSEAAIPEAGARAGAVPAPGSAAPAWIELIPGGEFRGRDGRGPFRMAQPAAVIAATHALGLKAGIPIDYDHATDFAAPEGRPAPAAGWIREFELRGGAVWGRVEWTRHGRRAVVTREYRYISPVFEYRPNGEVVRLLRAALTNNPNLYLTAISARAPRGATASVGGGRGGENRQEEDVMEKFLAQLREMLGLDNAVTNEELLAAVRGLKAAGDDDDDGDDEGGGEEDPGEAGAPAVEPAMHVLGADPGRYVPVAQFQNTLSELNSLKAARARERAEHTVNEAIRAGKLIPAQRGWAVAYCQANYEGFASFIARQPALLAEATGLDGAPPAAGHGAQGDSMMRASVGVPLSQSEIAVCANLSIRPEDFARHKAGPGYFLRLNH